MKNNLKNVLIVASSIILGIVIYACSDTSDDYLKYVEGGEITYIGKLDSLQVFAGLNRVQIVGKLPSDPKAKEARIYWNNMSDSIVVPISRTGGSDKFSTIIDNLPENIYSFQIRTFDDIGNKSVVSTVTGAVYGDNYIATLFNRPIITSFPSDAGLEINFDQMDRSTGVIGSEIVYTTTSASQSVFFVDIDSSTVVIPDYFYENGSTFDFRTAFVPEEFAIDTIYTEYEVVNALLLPLPIVPELRNEKQPFVGEVGPGGRWGNLAEPWITNSAAKTHYGNLYGGFDNGCCNNPVTYQSMNLEAGWGEPSFTNAKVYQVTFGDAGKNYRLSVNVGDTNYASGNYIVVALGNGLPDVSAVPTDPKVLVSRSITSIGTKVLDFTLSEVSQISIGIVSTQSGNRYCNITSWKIEEL